MAALTTAILTGLAIAQTAKTVVDDRKSAKAARKQAGFEAGILEQQAADTELIGQETVARSESATRGLTGAQRAAQAAQGLDLSSGSASDVMANDAALGAIDAQTLKNNAAREALGLRKQADLVRMGGKNAAQSINNHAVGTLLSGATTLYGIYDAYGKTSGVPRGSSSGSSGAQGGYRSGTASK